MPGRVGPTGGRSARHRPGADVELVREVAECVLTAAEADKELFIPLKEAGRRLNMCAPKLQGYARAHYKGCPAVLEGNKYLFNARMLPDWADRLTLDAIEGRA